MNFIAKSAGNTDSNIGFWTEAVGGSPTEKLRITSDGKIGIGEDNPDGNYLLIRAASTVGTTKGHIMLTGDGATNGEGPQIVFSESGSGSNFAGAYIGHIRATTNSVGHLVFGTRESGGDANTVPIERLRITSTGKVLIGHNTPIEIGVGAGYQMPLQVIGTSYDTSGMVVARYQNNDGGPSVSFVKSRNATKGAQTIVQANDTLGMIRFLGSDGTDTQNAAARIRAFCDGTPASNKIPGRITFETTDTLTYARERMRIDSSGRVVIGGPGSNGGGSNTYIGGGALAVLGTPYTPNTYACFAMGRVGANVTANTPIANIRLNGGPLGTGRGAEINAYAESNWSDASSHPTRLTFHTAASGSTSTTEKLRITSTGRFGFNRTAPHYAMHLSPAAGETRIDLHMTNSTTGHGATDGVQFGYQNTAGAYIWNFENTDIYFGTTNNPRLYIRASTGHLEPHADNAQNLGSSSNRWANIYTGDLQLSNVTSPTDQNGESQDVVGNDVDGTQGTWTIQEGANDLFIINRVNGKKYKFNLTEVS